MLHDFILVIESPGYSSPSPTAGITRLSKTVVGEAKILQEIESYMNRARC
jgi:hypothetical protein